MCGLSRGNRLALILLVAAFVFPPPTNAQSACASLLADFSAIAEKGEPLPKQLQDIDRKVRDMEPQVRAFQGAKTSADLDRRYRAVAKYFRDLLVQTEQFRSELDKVRISLSKHISDLKRCPRSMPNPDDPPFLRFDPIANAESIQSDVRRYLSQVTEFLREMDSQASKAFRYFSRKKEFFVMKRKYERQSTGSIRLHAFVPSTGEEPGDGATCAEDMPQTSDVLQLLSGFLPDTPEGQVLRAAAQSTSVRNRLKGMLGLHDGDLNCQVVCGVYPRKARKVRVCVDGGNGQNCRAKGPRFDYEDFGGYWADVTRAQTLSKDGKRVMCFLLRNHKHNWGRNFLIDINY